MLRKNTVLLFVLNTTFCSAETEFNYTYEGTFENLITVKHLNFTQCLDHNNPEDKRKFIQRYAVTTTYYKKSGPAFLLVKGEETLQRGHEFTNNVLAYAQNLNAICFSLEHRFYGGSWPVNGSIVDHLSSAQALADIAYFINGVTKEFHLPKDTKWIALGCSYAGALAAWSKLKYPHIILGAVASSANVLAKVYYFEYEQIIEESLRSYDPKCVESISQSFEEIVSLVNNTEIRKNISQIFYVDDDGSGTFDHIKSMILKTMLVLIGQIVQHNDSHRIPIPLLCRIMIEYNGTKLEALAEIAKMYREFKYNMKTISSKPSQNQNSMEDDERKIRETWRYQRCSEFGYFTSFTNVTFLSPIKHLFKTIEENIDVVCKPLFGPNFSVENVTEKVRQTNVQYGGLNINVSNTIFIHGSLDPYYKTGIYKKSNVSLYETIFIQGTSHCADVHPPRGTDIPELRNARIKIFKTMKSWLDEIPSSNNSRN